MKTRRPHPALHLAAFALGAPPAFFLVFAAVLSGAPNPGERVLSFLLVVLAYAVLGGGFAFVWPAVAGRLAFALSAPAALLLAWYTAREPQQAALHAAYLVAAGLAGWLGGELVARFRVRRRTVLP